jgi:hypothetical protein
MKLHWESPSPRLWCSWSHLRQGYGARGRCGVDGVCGLRKARLPLLPGLETPSPRLWCSRRHLRQGYGAQGDTFAKAMVLKEGWLLTFLFYLKKLTSQNKNGMCHPGVMAVGWRRPPALGFGG